MAQESATPDLVEVVAGLFEAADRGDWDTVLSAYAPYAVLETADGVFDAVSPARMRGFWEEVAATFEDFAIKVETVVDLGNGIVYSIYRAEGRLAGSTGVVTERTAMIYEWVDGRITRLITRPDVDEARAAAERLAEERRSELRK
jgi:ketosteroid isomerase-like protein